MNATISKQVEKFVTEYIGRYASSYNRWNYTELGARCGAELIRAGYAKRDDNAIFDYVLDVTRDAIQWPDDGILGGDSDY